MYNGYGLNEIIYNAFSLIYTKIFWHKARLVRMIPRVRYKKGIEYGKGFTVGYSARIEANYHNKEKTLHIGENVVIGDYLHLAAYKDVNIGNNVLIASRVFISDVSHGEYNSSNDININPNSRQHYCKSVIIEDNVWIGENVSILQGVTIGKNVIVGSNSVVTKSIPAYTICAGIPARPIKQYDKDKKEWIRL